MSGEQSSNRASHKAPGTRGPVAAAAGCAKARRAFLRRQRRRLLRSRSQPAAAATGRPSNPPEQVDLLMRCWLGNSYRPTALRPAR
ncbi:hypothetical protein FJD36_12330 [Pseudomonas chlororaphis subsp. chlororaphis]|nr:hypothetical protein FJD36_12330 [Pseudomonas chlororaphis subsp. chlororaphis]